MSCPTGSFLSSGNCIKTCPTGYFGNSAINTCDSCNSACSSCAGGLITQCGGCNDGYLLSGNTCVPGCISGKYLNSGKCLNCSTSCQTCNDGSSCASCSVNLFLTPTAQCSPTCPDGYYKISAQSKCGQCQLTCGTCSGPLPTDCQTC